MNTGRLRAIDYLLWIAVLAWPLGVFAQTPIPGVNLFAILAIVLAALIVPDALADRKLRVPFEIWMPSAVIAFFVIFWSWTDPAPRHRDTIEAIVLFLLIVQAAPSRDAIQRYLFAAVISTTVVTFISLLTPWLGLLPTAFSFRTGTAFTFPYTLIEGVHILFIGASLGLYVASNRRFSPGQRAWATGSFLLIAILLVGQGIQWLLDTGEFPAVRYPKLWTGQWAVAAVALWLLARVLAKVELARRLDPDPLHWFWWMAGGATLLVIALAPFQSRAYQGVLLGLACATALPPRLNVRAVRWPLAGSFLLGVVLATNVFVVFPGNTTDPRQYDAAAQREMPRIFDRMEWVDRHAPNERRTFLWRARAALDSGLPNLASFAFERATRVPEGSIVLAPPSESERQQFLVDMRDAVATLPEDRAVCAYERVLLANGERDSALYSLRLQTSVPLMHALTPDTSLFTPVVALILNDPSLAEDLRAWNPDEVLTLLSHWGTDAAFAVGEGEAPGGVFILAAQRTWDTFNVLVRVGEQISRFEEPLAPVTQQDILALTQISAMVWAGPEDSGAPGMTRYTLNVVTADGVRPAAFVDLRNDGSAAFIWAKDPPVVEFTPAVRVRLAK